MNRVDCWLFLLLDFGVDSKRGCRDVWSMVLPRPPRENGAQIQHLAHKVLGIYFGKLSLIILYYRLDKGAGSSVECPQAAVVAQHSQRIPAFLPYLGMAFFSLVSPLTWFSFSLSFSLITFVWERVAFTLYLFLLRL